MTFHIAGVIETGRAPN
jgi:hypothetical protein